MNQKFTPAQMRKRYLDVAREIALGKSSAQMQQSLGLTKSQVTNARSKLYEITTLQDIREITIFAQATGLVTQQELEQSIPIKPF